VFSEGCVISDFRLTLKLGPKLHNNKTCFGHMAGKSLFELTTCLWTDVLPNPSWTNSGTGWAWI